MHQLCFSHGFSSFFFKRLANRLGANGPDYLTLEQLGPGEAGRLQAAEGEKLSTARRRLGDAGRQLEKKLTIRRTGEEIYFWIEGTQRRGRGRPRKSN